MSKKIKDDGDHCTMVRVRLRVASEGTREGQVLKGVVNHSKALGFHFLYKRKPLEI